MPRRGRLYIRQKNLKLSTIKWRQNPMNYYTRLKNCLNLKMIHRLATRQDLEILRLVT
jgi:hypothetical protein